MISTSYSGAVKKCLLLVIRVSLRAVKNPSNNRAVNKAVKNPRPSIYKLGEPIGCIEANSENELGIDYACAIV